MYEIYKSGNLIDTCESLYVAREMMKFYGGRCYIQYTEDGIAKYEESKYEESK